MIKATASANVTVKRPYENIKARLQLISRPPWKKAALLVLATWCPWKDQHATSFINPSIFEIKFVFILKLSWQKDYWRRKLIMAQIVINKISASMTFMSDQKYLLVVLYEDQYIFLFTGIAWVWKTILCTYGLRRVRLCCGPHHLKAKQLPQGELLGHPQQGT